MRGHARNPAPLIRTKSRLTRVADGVAQLPTRVVHTHMALIDLVVAQEHAGARHRRQDQARKRGGNEGHPAVYTR